MDSHHAPIATSPTPWTLRPAIFLIAMLFAGQLFFVMVAIVVLSIVRPDAVPASETDLSVLAAVALNITAYLFAAAVTFELIRHFARSLGWSSWRDAVAMRASRLWPIGVGAAIVTAVASDALSVSLGRPIVPPEQRAIFADLTAAVLFSLFSVAVPPLIEELSFRGVLYPALERGLGRGLAIALNGLVFGAVHIFTYGLDWYVIGTTVVMGMMLAGLRAHTRSLWPSIAGHFTLNAYASLEALLLPGILGYWP